MYTSTITNTLYNIVPYSRDAALYYTPELLFYASYDGSKLFPYYLQGYTQKEEIRFVLVFTESCSLVLTTRCVYINSKEKTFHGIDLKTAMVGCIEDHIVFWDKSGLHVFRCTDFTESKYSLEIFTKGQSLPVCDNNVFKGYRSISGKPIEGLELLRGVDTTWTLQSTNRTIVFHKKHDAKSIVVFDPETRKVKKFCLKNDAHIAKQDEKVLYFSRGHSAHLEQSIERTFFFKYHTIFLTHASDHNEVTVYIRPDISWRYYDEYKSFTAFTFKVKLNLGEEIRSIHCEQDFNSRQFVTNYCLPIIILTNQRLLGRADKVTDQLGGVACGFFWWRPPYEPKEIISTKAMFGTDNTDIIKGVLMAHGRTIILSKFGIYVNNKSGFQKVEGPSHRAQFNVEIKEDNEGEWYRSPCVRDSPPDDNF